MMNQQKLTENIKVELENLNIAVAGLQQSMQKCTPLLTQDDWSFSQSESIDSLMVKFSRISDIFTQKILTSIVVLSLEDFDGFIDKINICEKLGVIISAQDVADIRQIRNKVSHEYANDAIVKIFHETLEYASKLLANIDQTKTYINQNYTK